MARSVPMMRRSYCGYDAVNERSRGISQRATKFGGASTAMRPRASSRRAWASPAAKQSKPSRSFGSIASAAGVSSMARVSRRKSSTPRYSSRLFTCCEIAAGVTKSSSAARLKLRWRAAASKARRALSGGRRSDMSID